MTHLSWQVIRKSSGNLLQLKKFDDCDVNVEMDKMVNQREGTVDSQPMTSTIEELEQALTEQNVAKEKKM